MQDKVSTLQPIELQLPVMSVAEMRKTKGGGDYGPDPGNGCYNFGDDFWDDVKQFFDGVGDGLGDLFGDIGDGIGDLLDALGDLFGDDGDPDYEFDMDDFDIEMFLDHMVDEGWIDDLRHIIEQHGNGVRVYPWDSVFDKSGDNTSPWENPDVTNDSGTIADLSLYDPDRPGVNFGVFQRVTELLDNNSVIASLLQDFDNGNGQLIFKIDDLSGDVPAVHRYPASMGYYFNSWFPWGPPTEPTPYTLTINSDFLNSTTTDLTDKPDIDYEGTFFTGMIAHETTHAQITLWLDNALRQGFAEIGSYSNPPYNNSMNFLYREDVINKAGAFAEANWTTPEQQALFNYVFTKDVDGNYSMDYLMPDEQHELIANFYRDDLIAAMQEYDDAKGLTHSNEWYQAASWLGLTGTTAYATFSSDPANQPIVDLIQEISNAMRP